MPAQGKLYQLLFIDVKTVAHDLASLNPILQATAAVRAARVDSDLGAEQWLAQNGALHAEYARVSALALGYLTDEDGPDTLHLRTKVIMHESEEGILNQFLVLMQKPRFAGRELKLVAHNGKEFDLPFLARRLVVNGLKLPPPLNLLYKRSFENQALDTLEMWRFGERRHLVSLPVLAALLGLTDDPALLEHNKLAHQAFVAQDWPALEQVCRRDIELLVNIFLKMNGYPPLSAEQMRV